MKFVLKILFLVLVSFNMNSFAQGIGIGVDYSVPVAGLKEWFKPAPQIQIRYFADTNRSFQLEYVEFSKENLSGYPKNRLSLFLQHGGILYVPRFAARQILFFVPYIETGIGLYYWKGIRGAIAANEALDIPRIDKLTLEEWNWGAKLGVGLTLDLIESLQLDIFGNYRFIVGDLWPTLQQYIELENVSGLQTINFGLRLNYKIE